MTRWKLLLRRLARSPAFSVVVALTVALGFGTAASVFSVVDTVVLRPLPYPDADGLYAVWHRAPGMGIPDFEHAEETWLLYREGSRSFAQLGLYRGIGVNLSGEGDPERVSATEVSGDLFPALGVPPASGRWIQVADEPLDAPPVVVLSHGLWTRKYGADPGVVGRSVEIDGQLREVVGVMPEGFAFPDGDTRLWIQRQTDRSVLPNLNFSFQALGRLAPGVDPETAATELNGLLQTIPEVFPGGLTPGMLADSQMETYLRSLTEVTLGDVAELLWVIAGAAGLLLAVVLVNVVSLFFARGEAWSEKALIHGALGAGPWQRTRPLVEEATLLCALGAGAGLLGARSALATLRGFADSGLPRLHELGVTPSVAILTVALALTTGFVVGVAAALGPGRAGRESTEVGVTRGGSRRRSRVRTPLVVVEVALALVLLAGSGLMVRTFLELRSIDPGFETVDVLAFRLMLPAASYSGDEISVFYDRLVDGLEAIPGVEEASTASFLPLGEDGVAVSYLVEDFPPEPEAVPRFVLITGVTEGFFDAMGMELLEGRELVPEDHRVPNHVVVVSRSFAEATWPGQSPLGKRITRGNTQQRADWMTIVGVVSEVRAETLVDAPEPAIWVPVVHPHASGTPIRYPDRYVVVKSGVPTAELSARVREAVWALDGSLPVVGLGPLRDRVAASVARTTFVTAVLGAAAAVTLAIGAIGLYGLLAYLVSRRTREIGIRISVGATTQGVRRMVLQEGMGLVVAGVAIGLLASLGLAGVLEPFLVGLTTRDPVTYAGVAALLLLVGAAASDAPARSASRVDPVRALRSEG